MELLIVIVVIGILAAISIVAYSGIQNRATYAREQSDMKILNVLVNMYYVENGTYPSTGGSAAWNGWSQSSNIIPGIVPKYAASMPQMPKGGATENSYFYTSNGTDYKLIRYSSTAGLPAPERTGNSLGDPARNTGGANGAWGYWTAGAITW